MSNNTEHNTYVEVSVMEILAFMWAKKAIVIILIIIALGASLLTGMLYSRSLRSAEPNIITTQIKMSSNRDQESREEFAGSIPLDDISPDLWESIGITRQALEGSLTVEQILDADEFSLQMEYKALGVTAEQATGILDAIANVYREQFMQAYIREDSLSSAEILLGSTFSDTDYLEFCFICKDVIADIQAKLSALQNMKIVLTNEAMNSDINEMIARQEILLIDIRCLGDRIIESGVANNKSLQIARYNVMTLPLYIDALEENRRFLQESSAINGLDANAFRQWTEFLANQVNQFNSYTNNIRYAQERLVAFTKRLESLEASPSHVPSDAIVAGLENIRTELRALSSDIEAYGKYYETFESDQLSGDIKSYIPAISTTRAVISFVVLFVGSVCVCSVVVSMFIIGNRKRRVNMDKRADTREDKGTDTGDDA